MVRVNLLTMYNSPNSLALVYPLLVNQNFFKKRGIKFYFLNRIEDGLYNCDILFIDSKFFRLWHSKKSDALYEQLESFRKRIPKILWFDTTDSTGTTQFNVMPYVDGYYKSQLLKDGSLYKKEFYGHRLFTDYYRREFGLEDDIEKKRNSTHTEAVSVPLKKEDARKLHLSWNSAMNDWGTYNYVYGGLEARMKSRLPFATNYKVRFSTPERIRDIDIQGRIGFSHARNTVRYQRERIAGILKKRFNVDVSKIPRRKYLREIKNSKIGISPFGMGEISCRDFEIIVNGAMLFKQDMSHLETWPPLYVSHRTYISYSWDLSDFEEKLSAILKDAERIKAISREAQKTYDYYLYGEGMEELRSKVLEMVKERKV